VVEVLVAMGLFGVLGTLLLGLALSTSDVTESTSRAANLNEESRLALERLTRELRQTQEVLDVDMEGGYPIGITVATDFDGNGVINPLAVDPEVVTYRWDSATEMLTITANDANGNAITSPVLAAQVSEFRLDLGSSRWDFDTDGASGASWEELDAAPGPVGNQNGVPDLDELPLIDRVGLSMSVRSDGHERTYSTDVHLRNAQVS
jgi:type II secretory pathway pseudopilin PulG